MPELPDVALAHLVRVLNEQAIPYAIIGGVAVSLMSTPRSTVDVDAVIWVQNSDIEALVVKFIAAGLTPRSSDPSTFASRHRMILLRDENGVEVDLSLGALPFEEAAIRDAVSIEIEPGLEARIASPEALVVMKAIASRPRDLEDIRQLLKMNPKIDRISVSRTVAEFADLLESPELYNRLTQLFAESEALDS